MWVLGVALLDGIGNCELNDFNVKYNTKNVLELCRVFCLCSSCFAFLLFGFDFLQFLFRTFNYLNAKGIPLEFGIQWEEFLS